MIHDIRCNVKKGADIKKLMELEHTSSFTFDGFKI